MRMRLYLAAKYSRREELNGYAADLRELGHIVECRWLSEEHDLPLGAPAEDGIRFALDDIEDIRKAHGLIAFTEEPGKPGAGRNRGGRHVELGIALGSKMPVFVVGWRENVFCYLPEVTFFRTWSDAMDYFLELRMEGYRSNTPEPSS